MKVVFKWFIRVNVLPYAPISSSSFAFTDFATQVGTRPLEGVFGACHTRPMTGRKQRNVTGTDSARQLKRLSRNSRQLGSDIYVYINIPTQCLQ